MSLSRVILYVASVVLLAVGADKTAAQIKVIPRDRIDSIAHPRTVANSGMMFLDGERIDLGDVEEADGVVERVVEWENRGTKPIVITRIKSSCSCLAVTTQRTTVNPSERGRLTLRFNPTERLGGVSYRVLIYSSLSDKLPTAVLHISGSVLSAAEGRSDYPEQCGALLLKSRRVRLSLGEEVRIACMNGGEQSLTLSEDNLLTPRGVELYTEPKVLRSGERGDVVIKCTSDLNGEELLLYIKGLALPPRQRSIMVELEK